VITPGAKIAVLSGGPSCEREVSLISGNAVLAALKERGYDAFLVDPDVRGDFAVSLKSAGVSAAFIALHGTFGEDGAVQEILDRAGIVYTGSGPEASRVSFDKSLTQKLLREKGIGIPEFVTARAEEVPVLPFGVPLVVKPSNSGSSVGVTILHDASGYAAALKEAFKYSSIAVVERFIDGRELTVGILGGRALPVVEVVAASGFYDYEAKYKSDLTRYDAPARITPREASAVTTAALKTYEALGCEVMARVDVILGADGRPYVLEANTIPGLTGKSLLPKAAKAAGIEFPDLCVRILELSFKRQRVTAHGKTA
jgi:D-alanine-D-alanine ligase